MIGQCLYCYMWFRSGQHPLRRFSVVPGQYKDFEGNDIPLEYLCETSTRHFHPKCARLSERAGELAQDALVRSPSDASVDSQGVSAVSDDQEVDDATQTLQLLSTPVTSMHGLNGTLSHHPTVLLDQRTHRQPIWAPSILKRLNTKYAPILTSLQLPHLLCA